MRWILAMVLLAPGAGAHDFWIEPATFRPEPGQVVAARLRVGQDLLGDALPRDPRHLREFVVEDAAGRRAVPGRNGADPAGLVRVAAPGLAVVGYASHPSVAEQSPEKFAQYLREEGLTHLAKPAGARGPVREMFARCAKSLVMTGTAKPADGADRALGLELELVAEKNPYALAPGEALPVRLTYEGKPLGGALVVAFPRADPSAKVSVRSGSDGRVRLALPTGEGAAGLWLVKAVHMVPAPADAGAQWLSYWASLTFEKAAVR